MSDDGWNAPRSYRREAIAPPVPLDEETLDALRQVLAADAHVAEAWVVGSRMTALDGAALESTDIAVVFDPTLADEEARVAAFTALMAELDARGHGRGTGGSWLIASAGSVSVEPGTCFYARRGAG